MSRSQASGPVVSELDLLKDVERTHAKAWDVSANRLRKMWHVFGRVLRQQLLEGLGECWQGTAVGVPGVGYWSATRAAPEARPMMEWTFSTAFIETYKLNQKPQPRKQLPFPIKDADVPRVGALTRVDPAHVEGFLRAMFSRLGELCGVDFNICLPHVGRFECGNRKPIFRFFGELLDIATPGGAADAPKCVGDSRVIESVQKWLSESATRPKTSMGGDARSAISSMSLRQHDRPASQAGDSHISALRRSPAVKRPQSGHVGSARLPHPHPHPAAGSTHNPHAAGHLNTVRALQTQRDFASSSGGLYGLASEGRGVFKDSPARGAAYNHTRGRTASPVKSGVLMAEVAYSTEGRERVPREALNTVMSEAYNRHAANLEHIAEEDRKHRAFLRQKSREQEQWDRQLMATRRDRMQQTSRDLERQVGEKVSRGNTPSFIKENVIPSSAGSQICLPQEPLTSGRDRRSEQRQLCEALEAQIAERRTMERQQKEADKKEERQMLRYAQDQLMRDNAAQFTRKQDVVHSLKSSWQRQVAYGPAASRSRQRVR